jgi:hypothetical protein
VSAELCSECSVCIDTDYDDSGEYTDGYVFSCGRCVADRRERIGNQIIAAAESLEKFERENEK